MRKLSSIFGIIALLFGAIWAAGCSAEPSGPVASGNSRSDNMPNATGSANNSQLTTDTVKTFRVEFKSEPGEINAGTPVTLAFTVMDKEGAIVRDLPIVHEKPMHLLVVSKDLAEFYHIHPEQSDDGSYRVAHTFPHGGEYKMYADFTPQGSTQVVEQIDVKVAGAERTKTTLVPDRKLEKTIDGLRVVMTPDTEIKAGEELMLNFQAFDAASGKPATDLEKYLGELAHFVIISEDMKDFVHAHPMSRSEHNEKGGGNHDSKKMDDKKDAHHADGHNHSMMEGETGKPSASEVSAHTGFPRAGLYKIWAQFQRGGRVITVPFTVLAGEQTKQSSAKNESVPADAVKVTVSESGYEPAEIKVEKGKPLKLAFYRADANNCGGEIVFSKLNLRKKLPVGETVLVEFTPAESGELGFACGMDMMKGKIVVN